MIQIVEKFGKELESVKMTSRDRLISLKRILSSVDDFHTLKDTLRVIVDDLSRLPTMDRLDNYDDITDEAMAALKKLEQKLDEVEKRSKQEDVLSCYVSGLLDNLEKVNNIVSGNIAFIMQWSFFKK